MPKTRHQRVGDEEAGGAPSPLQSLPYNTRSKTTKSKAGQIQATVRSSSRNRGDQLQNASNIQQNAGNQNGNGVVHSQGGRPTAMVTAAHDQRILKQQNNQQTNGEDQTGVNGDAALSIGVRPESTHNRPAKKNSGTKKKVARGRKRKRNDSDPEEVLGEILGYEGEPARKDRPKKDAELYRSQELLTGLAAPRAYSPVRQSEFDRIVATLICRDDPSAILGKKEDKTPKQVAMIRLGDGALRLAVRDADEDSSDIYWLDTMTALSKIDAQLDAGKKARLEAQLWEQGELIRREKELKEREENLKFELHEREKAFKKEMLERERALKRAEIVAKEDLNDVVDKSLQAYHHAMFSGARINVEPEVAATRDRSASYERLRPGDIPSTPSRRPADRAPLTTRPRTPQAQPHTDSTQSSRPPLPQTEPPRSRFSFRVLPKMPSWIPVLGRSTTNAESSNIARDTQNRPPSVGLAAPQPQTSSTATGDSSEHQDDNVLAPTTEAHNDVPAQDVTSDQSALDQVSSTDHLDSAPPVATIESPENASAQDITADESHLDRATTPTPTSKTTARAKTSQRSMVSSSSKGKVKLLSTKRKADGEIDFLADITPSSALNTPKRRKMLRPPVVDQQDLPLTRKVLGKAVSFVEPPSSLSQSYTDDNAKSSKAPSNKYGFQVTIDEYLSKGIELAMEKATAKLDSQYAAVAREQLKQFKEELTVQLKEQLDEEYDLKYKAFLTKLPVSIQQNLKNLEELERRAREPNSKERPLIDDGLNYLEARCADQVKRVLSGLPIHDLTLKRKRTNPRIGDPELPLTENGKIPGLENGGYGMNDNYFDAYGTDSESDGESAPVVFWVTDEKGKVVKRRRVKPVSAHITKSPVKSAMRQAPKYPDLPPTPSDNAEAEPSQSSTDANTGFSVPFGDSTSSEEDSPQPVRNAPVKETTAVKDVAGAQAKLSAEEESARAEQLRTVKEKADFVSQQKFRPHTPSKLSAMSKASVSPQSPQSTTPTPAATTTVTSAPVASPTPLPTRSVDDIMDMFIGEKTTQDGGALKPFLSSW